jgi:tetratricopeptide (TPR) repeat protein
VTGYRGFERALRAAAVLLLFAAFAASAERPEDAYNRGAEAFRRNQFEVAADAFAVAAARDPAFRDALILRARALVPLARYLEAEAALRRYLQQHPASADATYLLGFVLFREGRPAQSLAVYTAAAALRRPMAFNLKIAGLDYVLMSDYTDAILWLEKSVAEYPRDSEAFYNLGRAYYIEDRFDQAVAAFQQTLRIEPHYANAENGLGLSYAAQNQPDLAEQAYRRAIADGEASGKRSDQPYTNLAGLLLDRDRLPEALQLLDAANRLAPASVKIQELRGKALITQQQWPQAESAFRAALALSPNSGALHYQLGRVLSLMGRNDEARNEYARGKALAEMQSALNVP